MHRIDCCVAATMIVLGLLGCGSAEPAKPDDHAANPVAIQQPTPAPVPVSEIDLPPPRTPLDELEADAAASETAADGDAPGSGETSDGETVAAAAPTPDEAADPLAPILPSGPEPGSPEADAELTALLDESTLTQEEFDAAFRGAGPNVRDDQLVFDGGAHTHPVISIGAPKLVDGKFDAAKLSALAQADERKLIACHAMALAKDAKARGSLTLRLRFDDAGAVTQVEPRNAGAGLGAALVSCLESVAKAWRSPDAAKATVELPLTLSTQ